MPVWEQQGSWGRGLFLGCGIPRALLEFTTKTHQRPQSSFCPQQHVPVRTGFVYLLASEVQNGERNRGGQAAAQALGTWGTPRKQRGRCSLNLRVRPGQRLGQQATLRSLNASSDPPQTPPGSSPLCWHPLGRPHSKRTR